MNENTYYVYIETNKTNKVFILVLQIIFRAEINNTKIKYTNTAILQNIT